MENNTHQICVRCIMDTTDPLIQFDEQGICSHCKSFDLRKDQVLFPSDEGKEKINQVIKEIKEKNKHKKYDCILGLSGGVDSSYLAYWAAKFSKLRVLAVHVDGGWNSEIAVSNIEKIVKTLNIDLITHVVDWKEMRELQVAFLKSGVANQDTPQDHAFFAALYNFANKNDISIVLSGYNFTSESVLPQSWGYSAMDLDHIKSIYKRFGRTKLSKFPTVSFFKNYVYYPYIKRIKVISPLNYLDYDKENAIEILKKELGWSYYGGKHHESKFTAFFQSFWLPTRFNYDKRKAHLSSLVLAGQLGRDQALEIIKVSPFDHKKIPFEKEFIAKKLNISVNDLDNFLKQPLISHTAYKTNQRKMKMLQYALFVLSLPMTILARLFRKKNG
ncbi:NAD synthetase [Holospora obtusa F1]|uniref:NAD synthetase n=1 Tax=Holospora obtusa F1 TaxID=1399147 RepID=W6TDK7_HOLOB|nr:N-acetyl sugar amidotransferase [Holospora obtusa]ETZ07153.1 NAD synthetase [Holospora obtusa F1]